MYATCGLPLRSLSFLHLWGLESPISLSRGSALPHCFVQVIAKATVPLFKYEDIETGVKIDVSFNVANGPAVRTPETNNCLPWPAPRPFLPRLLVDVAVSGKSERPMGFGTGRTLGAIAGQQPVLSLRPDVSP